MESYSVTANWKPFSTGILLVENFELNFIGKGLQYT